MSDTETEAAELEETPDIAALEGSNATPDPPQDGAVARAEPEAEEEETDEESESRGMPQSLSGPGAGFIARFEGCVLRMYNDPTNNATIGVGHLIHLAINGREPQDSTAYHTRSCAPALMGMPESCAEVRKLITVPLKRTSSTPRQLHVQLRFQ